MSNNIHGMITRSKSKSNKTDILYETPEYINPSDDIDKYGNLKGLIDYDCNADFDHNEFNKQLSILSRNSSMNSLFNSPKKKNYKKKQKKKQQKKKKQKINQHQKKKTKKKHPRKKNLRQKKKSLKL